MGTNYPIVYSDQAVNRETGHRGGVTSRGETVEAGLLDVNDSRYAPFSGTPLVHTTCGTGGGSIGLVSVLTRIRPLVLIVDSEEHTRDLYADWFWFAGFNVMKAGFQEVVHRLVRRDQPDLVLTDLNVRGAPVLSLITTLHHDPATQEIPIVVMTRAMDDGQLHAAKEAGADVVLPKLVNFDLLLNSVMPLVRLRLAARYGNNAAC